MLRLQAQNCGHVARRGPLAHSPRCVGKAPCRRLVRTSVVAAPSTAPTQVKGTSGASETSWYAWPEGYLGQSFNLSGRMEPRATALQDDSDLLSQFCQVRREESQFSEHTITSAEDAAVMVSAVVGADVDMGLLKAGGSASFEMYQNYKSNTISHNLVASFQQNQLLEKNQLMLSHEAKKILREQGPQEFRARYGTHFVSGVGFRGSFIGAVNVRMTDSSQSIAAGATFKASYGSFSAMGDIKAAMNEKKIQCEVTVEWSKWGADNDASLDQLEENCASDNPSFTGIRQLAMQTADRAQGYPKLIKLRPYSTLPDYVEACNESGNELPQLSDCDEAMALLTKHYRQAAYILAAIQEEKRAGAGGRMAKLEATTKDLISGLEDAFKSKSSIEELQQYLEFKYDYRWAPLKKPNTSARDYPENISMTLFGEQVTLENKILFDLVNKLDLDLFKAIHKPVCRSGNIFTLPKDWQDPYSSRTMLHLAVASDGSATRPYGAWYLDCQEQEVFTKPGLYIVKLGFSRGALRQVGTTQCFGSTQADGQAASRFVSAAQSIFLAFKVGDCTSAWYNGPNERDNRVFAEAPPPDWHPLEAHDTNWLPDKMTALNSVLGVDVKSFEGLCGDLTGCNSWVGISTGSAPLNMRSRDSISRNATPPQNPYCERKQADDMVLMEAILSLGRR